MLYFLLMYSTIVGEAQQQRVGYLALPTHRTHRHLATCRRDAATLLPIIQQHVLPAYGWMSGQLTTALPGVAGHGVVNHSLHFVDPTTGVNTQTVESYWNRVKRKFKRMTGVSSQQLALHLDEFMWRERYGKTAGEAFTNICPDINTQYPV